MLVLDIVFTCCSRTSSCFGAFYRSSFPENLATSSRRFVLQTFVFLPRLDESGISWHQPDLNLRQIWWLEHFPKIYNIGSSITGKVDVVASTTQPKDLLLWYLDWRSWPPPHKDFVGFTSLVVPYGFLCSRSPTFLLDVLDIKPYLWVGYTSTSRRTLEAEC